MSEPQAVNPTDSIVPAPPQPAAVAAAPLAAQPHDMALYHLVSQRIDQLEGNLFIYGGEPTLPWFWLLLVFINGLSLGWLLTVWTH
jgi:hypothetical protein